MMGFNRHDIEDIRDEQMAHELRMGLTVDQVAERYGVQSCRVRRIREEQLTHESDHQAVQYE